MTQLGSDPIGGGLGSEGDWREKAKKKNHVPTASASQDAQSGPSPPDNNHLFLWVLVVEWSQWTHGQGYLLKANTKLYSFNDFGNPFEPS